MNTRQAAALLGITLNAVTGAIKYGSLKATKVKGQWEISEEAVEDYRLNHRGKPGNVSPDKAHERAMKAAETERRKRAEQVNITPEAERRIVSNLWAMFNADTGHGGPGAGSVLDQSYTAPDTCPPVVTREEWEAALARLSKIEAALFRANISL